MLQERWLQWKAGLYNLEMISPWGCNFQMGGLAYDIVAINLSGQEISSMRFVLMFLTLHLHGNNFSSLFWRSNPIQEKCSKHINIHYHYHIDRKKNPADILTENLSQVPFNCFHPSLGLEIL